MSSRSRAFGLFWFFAAVGALSLSAAGCGSPDHTAPEEAIDVGEEADTTAPEAAAPGKTDGATRARDARLARLKRLETAITLVDTIADLLAEDESSIHLIEIFRLNAATLRSASKEVTTATDDAAPAAAGSEALEEADALIEATLPTVADNAPATAKPEMPATAKPEIKRRHPAPLFGRFARPRVLPVRPLPSDSPSESDGESESDDSDGMPYYPAWRPDGMPRPADDWGHYPVPAWMHQPVDDGTRPVPAWMHAAPLPWNIHPTGADDEPAEAQFHEAAVEDPLFQRAVIVRGAAFVPPPAGPAPAAAATDLPIATRNDSSGSSSQAPTFASTHPSLAGRQIFRSSGSLAVKDNTSLSTPLHNYRAARSAELRFGGTNTAPTGRFVWPPPSEASSSRPAAPPVRLTTERLAAFNAQQTAQPIDFQFYPPAHQDSAETVSESELLRRDEESGVN